MVEGILEDEPVLVFQAHARRVALRRARQYLRRVLPHVLQQLLTCQYLYFCTSKANKVSTSTNLRSRSSELIYDASSASSSSHACTSGSGSLYIQQCKHTYSSIYPSMSKDTYTMYEYEDAPKP